MFLLPRILFIVCWWARFDTLASWVDWFPIHTRPLFVMCLVTFASVLFGAIALIPLCGHSPQIPKKKKKTSNFLIISAERWAIAIPCKQSLHSSGGFRGGARGTRAPTLFLDQTDSRRAEKSFFGDLPPSPYLRVWMTPPPPAPLSQGLDTVLHFRRVSKVRSSTFRTPVHTAKMCPLAG